MIERETYGTWGQRAAAALRFDIPVINVTQIDSKADGWPIIIITY